LSGLEVYSMNPDGSGVTRLTSDPATDAYPSLSPDGKKIAFVSTRTNSLGSIYVMNADGTGITRLTYSAATDIAPVWSKDGSGLCDEPRWNTPHAADHGTGNEWSPDMVG
jgi:Tol biopolymer transport system component